MYLEGDGCLVAVAKHRQIPVTEKSYYGVTLLVDPEMKRVQVTGFAEGAEMGIFLGKV